MRDKGNRDSIHDLLKQFDRRLKSIVGSERIPRAEKRARAEAAIRAVDELVSDIETGLSFDTTED